MPNLSSALYYVRFRGQITGPVDRAELRKMAQRGALSPIQEISADQMSWRPAGEFAELFDAENDFATLTEAEAGELSSGLIAMNSVAASRRGEDARAALPAAAGTSQAGQGRYYYSHQSATVGPVSVEVLRAQAANGSLKPNDPVWPEGSQKAVLAAHLNFLRGALAQAPRQWPMSGGNVLLACWIIAVVIVATVLLVVLLRN